MEIVYSTSTYWRSAHHESVDTRSHLIFFKTKQWQSHRQTQYRLGREGVQFTHCAACCLQQVCSNGQCTIVQIACNASGIYHVHRVASHKGQRDSPAIKFVRVEIILLLIFVLLAKTTNWWRMGGNTSTWRKPLTMSNRKSHNDCESD